MKKWGNLLKLNIKITSSVVKIFFGVSIVYFEQVQALNKLENSNYFQLTLRLNSEVLSKLKEKGKSDKKL